MHVLTLWLYFFLATASHGLLDAMTDGGLGVAFFSPFDNQDLLIEGKVTNDAIVRLSRHHKL